MRLRLRNAGPAVLFALVLAAQTVAGQAAPTSKQCLECHAVEGEMPAGATPDGTSIYRASWEKSVHAGFECNDCHAGTAAPHDVPLPRPDCSGCHSDAVEKYTRGAHGTHAAAGDSLAPNCSSCHDPHTVRSSSDTTSVLYRSRVAQVCIRCHADGKTVDARQFAVPHPAQAYSHGAHERALASGNLKAATCGDCHDSHAVLRSNNPASPVYRQNIPKTCGQCHGAEAEAFTASVHGTALERGATGAPVCNTCHGEHAVARLADGGRPLVVASETCESCHSNPTLARRYGLPTTAVASYEDSYHGRAARGGLARAAGCTSCHGAHRVLAKTDPASSIHPANLVQTCGSCHTGATAAFASSYAHTPSGLAQNDRAALTVRNVYYALIAMIIGGMLVHNGILWRYDIRREFEKHKLHAVHQRFNRGELRQHVILLVTFLTLTWTGFALRYPDDLWARSLAALGLDEGVRRILHRVAAVAFMLVSIYHLGWMFTRRGREQMAHMAPKAKDLREAIQNVAYHLGKAARRPDFSRFRYIEKAEYWALVWGTVVMVATGLILWFPETLRGPSWLVRVAEAIHLYEAWLAFLAIVVWHLFFVLVRPGVHGTFTAVTGRMDPAELAHEHPAEYARNYGGPPSREKLHGSAAGPEVASDSGGRGRGHAAS